MNHIVLIIVGLPGSGKTTASEFFRKKGFTIVRMGILTEDTLVKKGLERSEENEQKIRKQLRKQYGNDIYAANSMQYILPFLKKKIPVVIEGMRSREELNYYKSYIPSVKVVYLTAGQSIRYNRLKKRKDRQLSFEQARKRDKYELEILRINQLSTDADFIILNEDSEAEFQKKLNGIIKKI